MDRGSPPSLLTQRLHLRACAPGDVPMLVALWADPQVRRHLGGPLHPIEARHRADSRLAADDSFTVLDRQAGGWLGRVSVSDEGHGGLELSYELLPQAWGRGYGTEATNAVVAWAFETLRPPRLLAVTQQANAASTRLLGRLGAIRLDEFEEYGERQVRYSIPDPSRRPS